VLVKTTDISAAVMVVVVVLVTSDHPGDARVRVINLQLVGFAYLYLVI